MIESALINYGALGIWTLTLLGERYFYNKDMKKIVQNNTIALTKNYEVIKECQRK
jgi:hypothetical protein